MKKYIKLFGNWKNGVWSGLVDEGHDMFFDKGCVVQLIAYAEGEYYEDGERVLDRGQCIEVVYIDEIMNELYLDDGNIVRLNDPRNLNNVQKLKGIQRKGWFDFDKWMERQFVELGCST